MNYKKRTLLIWMAVLMLLLAGCAGSTKEEAAPEPEPAASQAADASETSRLTVAGYAGEDKEYALADLQAIGLETQKYSGRNKENNNERQVREYTGVMLDALLADAGYEKDLQELTLKIICSDGYTREYQLSSLMGLYFFDGEDDEKGQPAEPMIAIIRDGESLGNDKSYEEGKGSPFRLIYGQADYDSEYTKDFNMQGWASYIERIEVKKANE